MRTWDEVGLVVTGAGPEIYTTCPKCSHTRKKSQVKCLSANIEKGVWHCWHCEWAGSLAHGEQGRSRPFDWKPPTYRRPVFLPAPPTNELLQFFERRGIDRSVVEQFGIRQDMVYFPQIEARVPAIVFPYRRKAEVVNCKYRALSVGADQKKMFRQETDAEKIFYNVDSLVGQTTAYVVEGEMDVVACAMAGLLAVVSVPDGAPPEHSKPTAKKFEYLVNCESALAPLTKIILAVDGDGPGHALEEELARRLGQERCWRVQWPEGCKDANDVLVSQGKAALRDVLANAKPWPIENFVSIIDITTDIYALRRRAIPRGASTGWPSLDEFYTVMPGEMTIVTGTPGSGKSEFLDALMLNLMQREAWPVLYCSPENLPVTRHARKLIEKYHGGPFYDYGPQAGMTDRQIYEALEFMQPLVAFISPDDSLTIDGVLKRARADVFRRGLKGLVLDPWNEFDHRRAPGLTETEHISASLGMIRRFAQMNGAHVWVVAHPAKLQKDLDGQYPVPRPYDISGSAHWFNRADNCVTVWRNMQDPAADTEIHVQKVRSKYVGQVGTVTLAWDKYSGRYREA